MRIAICIVFLSVCTCIFGQSILKSQLDSLIKDSTDRFTNFKAGFKEKLGNDSVFYTRFNLEGTKDNELFISNEESTYVLDYYMAEIVSSVSEKQGKAMTDEWKDKILAIVGSSFQLKELTSKIRPSDYGWEFSRGYFSITIVYMQKEKKKDSLLLLQISHLHLRLR